MVFIGFMIWLRYLELGVALVAEGVSVPALEDPGGGRHHGGAVRAAEQLLQLAAEAGLHPGHAVRLQPLLLLQPRQPPLLVLLDHPLTLLLLPPVLLLLELSILLLKS